MDSMRHLSTSLPHTRRRLDHGELLADFRAAALSVTNLYKSAAATQDKARAAGYQDAVEELLAFLDQENLGLMDGEGWRVRQWATERLVDDGGMRQAPPSEGDDAVDDERKEEPNVRPGSRSSSPEVSRKMPPMATDSSDVVEDDRATGRRTATSEPPINMATVQQLPTNESFTFRSSHAYPTNHDREGNMDLDAAATAPSTPSTTSTSTPESASVRLIPRSNRSKHSNHNRRPGTSATSNNAPTINFNLGTGAGTKRKMPYPDFFDISGMNFDGQGDKDNGYGSGGGRGGKRGRHA